MRIDAISLEGSGPVWPNFYEKKKIRDEENGGLWGDKFKPDKTQPADTLFGVDTSKDIFSAVKRPSVELETKESPGFLQMAYLQFPNQIIRDNAFEIVSQNDSNDVKARKLQEWVYDNISYLTDEEQYGHEELWVPPVMTLQTGKGDCEDQAFLLHSLMLNAGIPADRIRTYGGRVDNFEGASGGHAWTAYRRESDNQWIVLDTTFEPEFGAISARSLMKDNLMYQDDLFFITLSATMDTPGTNRIREPEIMPIYTAMSVLQYDPKNMVGAWLNIYV